MNKENSLHKFFVTHQHLLVILISLILVSVLIFYQNNRVSSATSALSYKPVVGAVTDTEAAIYLRTDVSAEVQVMYSLSSDLANNTLVPLEPIQTLASTDFTGHIFLSGLSPETTYYYSIIVDGAPSAIQSLRTFPTPGTPSDFSFVILSDSNSDASFRDTYINAANDNPAFALQLGDFPHENPGLSPSATTSSWWKQNVKALQTSFFGLDFPSSVSIPFVHIWDDHDYGSDNANGTAWFKAIATAAFRDYFPVYPLPNPDAGNWQRFTYGQADFFLLDLRSQKDPAKNSMLAATPMPNDQKTWLKDALLTSTAPWKFIISTVSLNKTITKVDAWTPFSSTERAELVNFIRDNGIEGVVILSGDIHSAGGMDDGTYSFFPEISVPNTNKGPLSSCTGAGCGTWTGGIINPSETRGGHVLVTMNAGHAKFQIKDSYGRVLKVGDMDQNGLLTAYNVTPDPSTYHLAVTMPNTPATWTLGTKQQIKWTHDFGKNLLVKIELSRDGGTSWETIVPSVASKPLSGSYTWTVSGSTTESVVIKVSSLDGVASGTSSSSLSIIDPTITVTAPNTNVNWGLNTSQRIQWKHTQPPGSYVKIELSRDNGNTWELIDASVKNATGTITSLYDWLVTGVTTMEALIKISGTDGSFGDMSNTAFGIANPFLTVTNPNLATHTMTIGSAKTIKWDSNLGVYEKVKIELSLDGGVTYPIELLASTPSDGSQTVTPQSSWATSTARVKITWLKDAAVFDESDTNFLIK